MTPPELSIVIVTWNTREMTDRCLKSLRACRSDEVTEVIVVDNASTDGTAELIRTEHPGVRLIVNDSNRLYSIANNQGVDAARGRYICILNSDTELRPGVLEAMIDFLEREPGYAVVGPRLINTDGTVQASCQRFYDLWQEVYFSTFLGLFPPGSRYLHRAMMRDFDYQSSADVEQIMGACLVMRRSDFLEFDGFDPELSLYFNDHDLCRRFLARGKKTRFLADVEVLHHRGQSADQFEDLNIYWNRNSLSYLRKYHGRSGLLIGRFLLRYKWARTYFRILLGPRSVGEKRTALAELGSKMRSVLAPLG